VTAPHPPRIGPVVEWRPLDAADAPALRDLHASARVAEGTPDEVKTLSGVRHFFFERPGTDPSVDTLGGFGTGGALLAAGMVWCRPRPTLMGRAVLLGDVHPTVRRRGVGRELLRWQEHRALERFAAELPRSPLPRRIDSFAAETDVGRAALLRAAGYDTLRWFTKMQRPLAGGALTGSGSLAPLPAPIAVVPWSLELDEAIRDAHNDAFRDHFGFEPTPRDGWRHRISQDPHFLAAHSRLAMDGPRVVGYVLCAASDEETSSDAGPTAWLGIIGVRRGWRRRGVASVLIAAAMDGLREAGYASVLLDVDADSQTGAVGLYERHGFRPLRTEVLYGKEVPAPG
jgi:mycothiol synthase